MMVGFISSAVLPRSGLSYGSDSLCGRERVWKLPVVSPGRIDIQAAKHAQLKGAKKANRRRPKKHRPSDINRKPPPYPRDIMRVAEYVFIRPLTERRDCIGLV